jgi:hypothetical protein
LCKVIRCSPLDETTTMSINFSVDGKFRTSLSLLIIKATRDSLSLPILPTRLYRLTGEPSSYVTTTSLLASLRLYPTTNVKRPPHFSRTKSAPKAGLLSPTHVFFVCHLLHPLPLAKAHHLSVCDATRSTDAPGRRGLRPRRSHPGHLSRRRCPVPTRRTRLSHRLRISLADRIGERQLCQPSHVDPRLQATPVAHHVR